MGLSRKAKEAIKTGLAMTIAYGIALKMGWDKPMWAGFAVAFISLATIGQSLNKGAMRMFGSLVAVVVALTLIALFSQDRWLFMLSLSIYIGFCTYMMSGTKRQYFWNVCGFVCVIICMDAGPDPINAFNTAILRAQETGLGILVYSVIAFLLWPTNSYADFEAIACTMASTQQQLFQSSLNLMKGQSKADDIQALSAQLLQTQSRFGQLLEAAESDSYEVWEMRQQWRRYSDQASDLSRTMEQWRESFAEVQEMDLQHLLPNLDSFGAEIQERLVQIAGMLANQPPKRYPVAMDLALAKDEVLALSHFHKAALAVARNHLQHIEAVTLSLFDAISVIRGFRQHAFADERVPSSYTGFVPDPDRMMAVFRVMLTMWIAYLALIYIDCLPGGSGFVTMATSLGMAMATMPQVSVTLLFVPTAVSILVAGLVYIFIMPQLSSFFGLGLLIFAVTFAICYFYASPKQGLGRALGLAMFINIASISNPQTYSFLVVSTTALMFSILFLVLAITAYFPFSPHPERSFMRLLRRFFRSSEYLLSALHMDPDRQVKSFDRWQKAYHLKEITTLPAKLGGWSRSVDTKILSGSSPQHIQSVVTSLQGLSYRIQELHKEGGNPQAQLLVQELLADVRAWRIKIQDVFQRLSKDPGGGKKEVFLSGLTEIMDHLEVRIGETLDKAADGRLTPQDGENFYSLLGAYRGVSEALIEYTGSAAVIDWACWREERF